MQGPDGDLFTDPQIHSIDGIENGNVEDGTGYGPGNFGHQGIIKFIETHQCNALCRQLGLPKLRRDADLKQPSRWSTQCVECNIPRSKGTTSRLSPTRINTSELDKHREGKVDYPDLQAPHPPALPQQQQQQPTEAARVTAQLKLQQQEMLWQMHSEAPHLLSAHDAKNTQWMETTQRKVRERSMRHPVRKEFNNPRMEQVQEEMLNSPRSYVQASPRSESYEEALIRRLRSSDMTENKNLPRSPRGPVQSSPKTVMGNIPRMPSTQSPRDTRFATPMSPMGFADCSNVHDRLTPRSPLNMINRMPEEALFAAGSMQPPPSMGMHPGMGMHGAGAPWFRGIPHHGAMYM